ncbi:unnamed protein product [Didymodactylos carnosus]|uniref:Uncharacterized protein n=1 Tax=Didymodactylos carnosus TaxID=1234261 RepID=A0A815KHC1_9BILA|nr:unnamed protein product [Didymodactylos carnosus]CAF1391103.1 unnamed protein product [Didymodactylos carnosus]CAF3794752.1 unnamed protein product [Didymodactylos carnosus]CAF4285637.1 unnamed protein product [Didymodactylos carnosus]
MAASKDLQQQTTSTDEDDEEKGVSEKVQEILDKSKGAVNWLFNDQQLSDADLKLIADELKTDQKCERLDLQRCNLYPADASELAEMLKVNKTLKQLWLSHNYIQDKGFLAICEALREGGNKSLETLDLTGNHIKGKKVGIIEEMIQTNLSLTHLYLWGNPITEENRERLRNAGEERTPKLYMQ